MVSRRCVNCPPLGNLRISGGLEGESRGSRGNVFIHVPLLRLAGILDLGLGQHPPFSCALSFIISSTVTPRHSGERSTRDMYDDGRLRICTPLWVRQDIHVREVRGVDAGTMYVCNRPRPTLFVEVRPLPFLPLHEIKMRKVSGLAWSSQYFDGCIQRMYCFCRDARQSRGDGFAIPGRTRATRADK